MKEKVGFIGLGTMGEPMATRVAQAGYQLVVYDVRDAAMRPLADEGATAATSPRDVASRCTVILLSLPDSHVIEEVVLGKNGIIEGASKGTVVVDLSSAQPASTIKIGEQLASRGVDLIDSPVSGGHHGAEAGTLTLMVGGKKEQLDRCRPILSAFGKKMIHCGQLGSGDTTKAANNLLAAANFLATTEAMILATKAGLDPETVLSVINSSSGQSNSAERYGRSVLRGDFDKAHHMAMRLFHKDLGIATDLGTTLGVPMLITNLVRELFAYGVAVVGPESANVEIARCMEGWAGVKVRAKDVIEKE